MKRRVVLWMLIVVCAFAVVVTASQAGPGQLAFEAARKRELIDHDLLGAIAQYSSIVAKYGADDRLVSEALLRLAGCQEQLGQPEARTTYERLVKEYPDTASARDAQKKLDAFGARGSGLTATQHGGQSTTGAPSFDGRFFTLEDLDTGDLAVTELKTGRTTRVTFNAGARPFQHVVSSSRRAADAGENCAASTGDTPLRHSVGQGTVRRFCSRWRPRQGEPGPRNS